MPILQAWHHAQKDERRHSRCGCPACAHSCPRMPAMHSTPEIAAPATLSPWQCAHTPPELPSVAMQSQHERAAPGAAVPEPKCQQTDAPMPAHAHSCPLLAHMQRHAVADGRRTLVYYSRRCAGACSSSDLAGTPEARRSIAQSLAHAERVQPCYAGARARDCALMAARVLAGYQERAVSASEYCALLAIFSKHHGTQTRIFRYRHLTAVHGDGMSKAEKERLECMLLARFDWRLPYFLGPGCLALLMLAAVYGNALPLAARRAHERHADALFQHAEALLCSLPHAGLGVVELAFHVLRRRMRGCRRWERHAARIAREFGVATGALPWIEA